MLKIKLSRVGKKKQPHYRFVVNEARDKRDGAVSDSIGHYAPNQIPKVLEINVEKYEAWLKKGAQPTETVAGLFKRLKSGTPFPVRPAKLSKKAKAKQLAADDAANQPAPEAEEPAAPAVDEVPPTVETPVEEAPVETPPETTDAPAETPAA
jgi:small subunit ribosomal protein S16